MQLQDFTNLKITPPEARKKLIRLLQLACSGEKAAANAYYGHFKSPFVSCKMEKTELKKIYNEELHHRRRIQNILAELGAKPDIKLEVLFFSIGFIIGTLCLFGGWFIPMYGAGKLESTNISEYEIAARFAHLAHEGQYIDELLEFAELEWDHELYFRNKAKTHFLYKFFPKWIFPKEKYRIKKDMTDFIVNNS